MSLSGRGISQIRGASVLAALVLVAILGVAYVAVQYARNFGDFAERSNTAFLATAAIATPSAGSFTGCTLYSDGTRTCTCAQRSRNPKASNGSMSTVQNCLPGCVYDVHPGASTNPTITAAVDLNPPKIVTESNPTESDRFSGNPDSSMCKVKVCTSSDASSCVLAAKSTGSPSANTGSAPPAPPAPSNPQTEPCVSTTITPCYGPAPSSGGTTGAGSGIPSSDGQAVSDALGGCGTDSFNPCPTNTGNTSPQLGSCGTDSFNPCSSGSNPSASGSGEPCSLYSPCTRAIQTNPDLSQPGDNSSGNPTPPSDSNAANPCASNEVTINGTCQEAPAGVSTSCASGEVLVAGNCVSSKTLKVSGGNDTKGGGGNTAPASGGLPDIGQFLQGLVKGLTGKGGGGGGSGTSNQQQQQNAPYGRGTDGAACYQPPVKPLDSSCTIGTWQSTSLAHNGCVTGWQCVPGSAGSGGQPSATLSCQPQIADVGMTISFSYACSNATGSSGSGFNTQNALSGSTTTIIATPPAGANTASYGITCINGTQTASQQCSIQLNKPWISLVAIPSVVAKNGSSAIGWVTGGLKSCALSIMNASATSSSPTAVDVSGVNTLFSIATTTSISLTCQTLSGGMSQATSSIIIQ